MFCNTYLLICAKLWNLVVHYFTQLVVNLCYHMILNSTQAEDEPLSIRKIVKIIPFLLLSVIANFTFGSISKLPVSDHAQCVLNSKSNTFMVFGNSDFYLTVTIGDSIWEKHRYRYLPEHIRISDLCKYYSGISTESGKILFIHNGVGEVYELRNDSVIRIDQSFNHHNQYEAAIFSYNDKVYSLGGYGLFTTKNLFLFFNESSEWALMPSDVLMYPRMAHHYQISDHCLYVFGGHFKREGDVSLKRNDCWKFDFITGSWTKLGQLNMFFEKESSSGLSTSLLELYFSEPYIYSLNCVDNKVEKYLYPDIANIKNGYFDTSKNFILLDHVIGSSERFFSLHTSDAILRKEVSGNKLYTNLGLTKNIIIGTLILALLSVLVVVLFRRNRKSLAGNKNDQWNKIIKIQNDFYINGKKLEEYFSGKDLDLILYFLDNRNEFLDLNTLDDIFISEKQVTTLTLKKRREKSYKLIKDLLSLVLNLPVREIFIESLDNSDKRIKKIKLNPKLF